MEHVDALYVDLQAFVDRDPYEFVIKNAADMGGVIIRVCERERPPLRFSTLFGDLIHNLRSALDHLAWQLGDCERPQTRQHRNSLPGLRG